MPGKGDFRSMVDSASGSHDRKVFESSRIASVIAAAIAGKTGQEGQGRLRQEREVS